MLTAERDMKLPDNIRTVKFWVRYDTDRKAVTQVARFKHEIPQPSKESAQVIFQVKGVYARPVGKSDG